MYYACLSSAILWLVTIQHCQNVFEIKALPKCQPVGSTIVFFFSDSVNMLTVRHSHSSSAADTTAEEQEHGLCARGNHHWYCSCELLQISLLPDAVKLIWWSEHYYIVHGGMDHSIVSSTQLCIVRSNVFVRTRRVSFIWFTYELKSQIDSRKKKKGFDLVFS